MVVSCPQLHVPCNQCACIHVPQAVGQSLPSDCPTVVPTHAITAAPQSTNRDCPQRAPDPTRYTNAHDIWARKQDKNINKMRWDEMRWRTDYSLAQRRKLGWKTWNAVDVKTQWEKVGAYLISERPGTKRETLIHDLPWLVRNDRYSRWKARQREKYHQGNSGRNVKGNQNKIKQPSIKHS